MTNRLAELKSTIISNFVQRFKRQLFNPVKTYEEFATRCKDYQSDETIDELDRPMILTHESCSDRNNDNYLPNAHLRKKLLDAHESAHWHPPPLVDVPKKLRRRAKKQT